MILRNRRQSPMISIVVLYVLLLTNTYGQDISRRAIRGFSFEFNKSSQGVLVSSIDRESGAYKSGLRDGDIIVSIDGVKINDYQQADRHLYTLKAGKKYIFNVERRDENLDLNISFAPLPKEEYPATEVEYGSITFNGNKIRTIVTKPKLLVAGKLPAVFLVPWLSCGSVEITGDPADGFDHIIKSFASNPEVLFFRVERMGVGDSQGMPCCDLDAETEIALYRQALQVLLKRTDVDPDQVYVLGLSLGMSLAPIVAEDFPVAGFMVSGGTTQTWYEHMLEFERHRLQLSGVHPDTVNANMKLFIPFYQQYLLDRKSPGEIIEQQSQYASIWYDMPYHQFGRYYTYFYQVQQLNFEKSWANVQVPVIAIHGEYDWVMSLQDHQRAVDIVNASGKSKAELVEVPKANHLLSTFATRKDAFDEVNGEIGVQAYHYMWSWLHERLIK